jgi:hypothetical protein
MVIACQSCNLQAFIACTSLYKLRKEICGFPNTFHHAKQATVQWHLAIQHDTLISISTLQATLKQARLTCKVLQKIASKQGKVSRAEFRVCLRDLESFSRTAMEFVAIDESSKDKFSRAEPSHQIATTQLSSALKPAQPG